MDRRLRIYGKTMVALLLLWQMAAIFHLAFALHTLCPEHGAVAHTDGETGQLEHHGGLPFSEGDDCFVLIALATHGGMPDLNPVLLEPVTSYVLEVQELRAESVILYWRIERVFPRKSCYWRGFGWNWARRS